MKERPILFTPTMAQAIAEGRKTQTRRVVKPQPVIDRLSGSWVVECRGRGFKNYLYSWPLDGTANNVFVAEQCPYGVPGDRLWVRESFRPYTETRYGKKLSTLSEGEPIDYRGKPLDRSEVPWRPNIHMPRWACRSVLEVVSVRVERVESITEADAIAEGVQPGNVAGVDIDIDGGVWNGAYRRAFLHLFYDINKRAPKGSNPWVWVVEFKRLEQA